MASPRVFLLAGQSNLTGRAAAADLPAEERAPLAAVRFDAVDSLGADAATAGIRGHYRTDGWIDLRPSPKLPSTPGDHFGPELSFGRTLAGRWPGRPLAIVKHGRGGTSLAEDWRADASSGLMLYAQFLDQARAALGRLGADGAAPVLGAFVWAQGEADATRQDWAESYHDHLQRLIGRVRADLEAPGLPVVIALTGDGSRNPPMRYAAVVRDAQRRIVQADPRAALVSGDDLSLMDPVHYDAAAQLILGRRLAEAYLTLCP